MRMRITARCRIFIAVSRTKNLLTMILDVYANLTEVSRTSLDALEIARTVNIWHSTILCNVVRLVQCGISIVSLVNVQMIIHLMVLDVDSASQLKMLGFILAATSTAACLIMSFHTPLTNVDALMTPRLITLEAVQETAILASTLLLYPARMGFNVALTALATIQSRTRALATMVHRTIPYHKPVRLVHPHLSHNMTRVRVCSAVS